jgi:hypothetical protein
MAASMLAHGICHAGWCWAPTADGLRPRVTGRGRGSPTAGSVGPGGRFGDLPHVDTGVEDHGAPMRWPVEWGKAALGPSSDHDDAVTTFLKVLENVAVVGKAAEEPAPCLHAGLLAVDDCTGGVNAAMRVYRLLAERVEVSAADRLTERAHRGHESAERATLGASTDRRDRTTVP